VNYLDGLLGCKPWSNELAPAAEAQHQVLLNKAQSDVQIRRHEALVDIDWRSPLGGAQRTVLAQRPRIVAHDAISRGNLRPDYLLDLVFGGPAMESCGNENSDVFKRNSRLTQAFEQRRQGDPVRRRPGDVANRDCGGFLTRAKANRGSLPTG